MEEKPRVDDGRRHLGFYVHVPFCLRKCDYCAFFSVPHQREAVATYFEALEAELTWAVRQLPIAGRFDTLYIGGGNPAVLTARELERLFILLHRFLDFRALDEVSCEANPDSLTPEKASFLRDMGVGRLSMGVQAMDDQRLALLGRRHSVEEAQRAFEAARGAGFCSLNVDLIFGTPAQALSSWRAELEAALAMGSDHLSAYALSLEGGAPIERRVRVGELSEPDDDEAAAMYETTVEVCGAAGLQRYEISNFARPGHECRHNQHTWRRGEYLGVGPSACSFLDGRRWRNTAEVGRYLELARGGAGSSAPPCAVESERLGREAALGEAAMLGLRTVRGFDLGVLSEEHGVDARARFDAAISHWCAQGLLEVDGPWVRLSAPGFLLADRVMADFLAPAEG